MTTTQHTQPPNTWGDKHDTTTCTHTDNHLIITHPPIFNLLSSTTLLQPQSPTPILFYDLRCERCRNKSNHHLPDHHADSATTDTHKKNGNGTISGERPKSPCQTKRHSSCHKEKKRRTQTDHIYSRSPMEIADGQQPTRKSKQHTAEDKQFLI